MQIEGLSLKGRLLLAPMAGVTDLAFREVCHAHGAALTTTEMVSTRALYHKDNRTPALLDLGAHRFPAAVQLFGHEPEVMAEGAKIAYALSGCDCIDINMGCPAPKIAGNGDGAALLREPALAGRIVEAVAKAVPVPVTVKMRIGWDAASINCIEMAKTLEQAGAAMLAVHGRTRAQQYSGTADWGKIREVVQAVSIPVAANGDVFAPEDVPRILSATGAAFVLLARGATGNPWLFSRANALLETGLCPPPPTLRARIDTAVAQITAAASYKGERVAMLEARRHVCSYLTGFRGLKAVRPRVCQLSTLNELYALADELRQTDEFQPV